jgi:hypothetical protein
MNLIPIKSSNIRGAEYNPETKTLVVQFSSGLYQVSDVTQDQYDRFMASESKGKFYAENFKNGKVRKL